MATTTADDRLIPNAAVHIMTFLLENIEDPKSGFDVKTVVALRSVNKSFWRSFEQLNGWSRFATRLQGIVDFLDEKVRTTRILGSVTMIDYKYVESIEQLSRKYTAKIVAIRETKLSVKPLASSPNATDKKCDIQGEQEGGAGTKRPREV